MEGKQTVVQPATLDMPCSGNWARPVLWYAVQHLLRGAVWYFAAVVGVFLGVAMLRLLFWPAWGDDFLNFLPIFALLNGVIGVTVAAVMVGYSRLKEQMTAHVMRLKAHEIYEKELQTAHEIQKTLLPRCAPAFAGLDICAGSIPARELGGDFYGFMTAADGRLFFIIGDVSGKGASAALYMAQAIGMFHVAVEFVQSPRALLALLHQKFSNSMARNSFITATCGVFDGRKRGVALARAGHEPALLLSNGGMLQIIQSQGMGVGLRAGGDWADQLQETHLAVDSGDILVLYTDGITEASNAAGEQFGLDRLQQVIAGQNGKRASEILDAIVNEVATHRDQEPLQDDLTLLVFRVLPAGSANMP